MNLKAGTVIDGKYEIRSLLGEGGFATVYEAIQSGFARRVAIKLMKLELNQADGEARFLREARILSTLQNRNIITCYGHGFWQGLPYIAMELVDGVSLSSLLGAEKRLPLRKVFHIFRQLCSGMAAAHANDVVHRDIKPDNIVVIRDGENFDCVKILDFGLAKAVATSAGDLRAQMLTQEGEAVGTVLYMSPEQCKALPATSESDIYAMGCILFHMLAGAPPFVGVSAVSIMSRQVSEEPPELNIEGPAAFANGLQLILKTCLQKEPSERYANAAELLEAIDNFLQANPLSDEFVSKEITAAAETFDGLDSRRRTMTKLRVGLAVSLAVPLLLVCAWFLLPDRTLVSGLPELCKMWSASRTEALTRSAALCVAGQRNLAAAELYDQAAVACVRRSLEQFEWELQSIKWSNRGGHNTEQRVYSFLVELTGTLTDDLGLLSPEQRRAFISRGVNLAKAARQYTTYQGLPPAYARTRMMLAHAGERANEFDVSEFFLQDRRPGHKGKGEVFDCAEMVQLDFLRAENAKNDEDRKLYLNKVIEMTEFVAKDWDRPDLIMPLRSSMSRSTSSIYRYCAMALYMLGRKDEAKKVAAKAIDRYALVVQLMPGRERAEVDRLMADFEAPIKSVANNGHIDSGLLIYGRASF